MIQHITYHLLKKNQHEDAEIDLNPLAEVPIDEPSEELLKQLKERYSGRAGKGYGYFEENTNNFPMSNILRDYLEQNDQDGFNTMTHRMMAVLQNCAQSEALATGGHVVICHYAEDGHDYIIVAVLTEFTGVSASDWAVEIQKVLDIRELKFAGRVDLTAWQNEAERYISFLKGGKQSGVSAYFQKFLGCDSVLHAKKETTKLIDVLKDFARDKGMSTEEKTSFLNDAKEYLADLNRSNEPFELATFANRVYPERPADLTDALAQDEVELSDGFIPDGRSLKKLTSFSGKTDDWNMTFTRDAVTNGEITYDREHGKITINNPPQTLIDALNNEL